MGITDRIRIISATALIACSVALPHSVSGSDIDWQRITRLKDKAFVDYVRTLNLRGQEAIDFWKKIPRNVTTPDLPMITREKQNIFGIETMSIEEWLPYSYGRH